VTPQYGDLPKSGAPKKGPPNLEEVKSPSLSGTEETGVQSPYKLERNSLGKETLYKKGP